VAAAGIPATAATGAFNSQVSLALAAGASPSAAIAQGAQVVQQMAAAAIRSGPATPAQAAEDALSTPATAQAAFAAATTPSALASSNALVAALASGATPAQAMAQSQTAAATMAAMLVQSTTQIPAGGALAAAFGTGAAPTTADTTFNTAYAGALALGLTPQAAQAAGQQAAATQALMESIANLPPTQVNTDAAAFAGGNVGAITQSLGADPQSAGAAALASALADGAPMAQALAGAAQAQSAAQAQLIQAQVPVDPHLAALAAGNLPDGCMISDGRGCDLDQAIRTQLQRATVPAVQPGLIAIAEGKLPADYASDPFLRRLLVQGQRRDAATAERVEEPVGRAALLLRLAQGVATDGDLARLAGGGDLPGFAAVFMRELAAGRSIEAAVENARAAAAGLVRDLASQTTVPAAPVKTAVP
jgi:predicted RNase H-like HicB family nuclease